MPVPQPPTDSSRPFAAAPDPSRYFPADAIEAARQRIQRSIQRGEGPVLVIGGPGLGKTLLLEVVARQFGEQLRAVVLSGGQLCTRRALLQMILFQLDLPYRDLDESELRLSLLSFLQPQTTPSRQLLLLVDEADALPPRLLEELRALTNVSAAGQLLVNVVLAGNATLEEQFADPALDLFSQRISARCYLSAFGREETFQYVRAQVAAAQGPPSAMFTDDGLEATFAATDGVPRLINQLGDQLLWMVAESGYSPLDGGIVQQAWSELQQLPAPWNTPTSETISSPIEYGVLDDEVDELGDLEFDTELDVTESEHESEQNAGLYAGLANGESVSHDSSKYSTDSDSTDSDDEYEDLPASIPLHATDRVEQAAEIIDLTGEDATYDATDHVLNQLCDLDAAEAVSFESIAPAGASHSRDSQVRNPFTEDFESEEIVLDRYSSFESLLLAEAPRVVNTEDIAFSQQLRKFEAQPPVLADHPGENISPQGLSIAEAAPECAADESPEPIGELLVIEESAIRDGNRRGAKVSPTVQ